MIRNSDDHGTKLRLRALRHEVRNVDPADCPDGNTCRPAHSRPQAQEDRGAHSVTHGDVRNRNVFDRAPVNTQNGQTEAAVEDAIRDGNVLVAAVRLRTELNAAIT